jgi:hypothetical protein
MGTKPKKKKLAERTMRGTRAAKALVKGTQERVAKALELIEADNYNTHDLLNDTMEQVTDVMTAFWSPTPGPAVPVVHFISNNTAPQPQTVALADSTKAGLITKTELVGVGRQGANLVPGSVPVGDYKIKNPDTLTVIGGGDPEELDEVVVEITNMPADSGSYRGVLRSGNLKVLAEIVVFRV